MDQKYFLEFYQKNVKRVYKFLFYRVGASKETAEDLTQEVFLKALAAFESYDPKISKSSWIFTIARHHLINHHEKIRPTVCLEKIENSCWDNLESNEKYCSNFDEKRLLEAIKQLPPEEAELIRLKYLEGWSYDDLTEKFNKNAGNLRVKAYRALKTIKSILKHK